jgi:hypothetical protein
MKVVHVVTTGVSEYEINRWDPSDVNKFLTSIFCTLFIYLFTFSLKIGAGGGTVC